MPPVSRRRVDGRVGRDRRGRGLRGPLAPPGVPAARTRAEQFDELVLASLARLESRWAAELDRVEVVVADVPDVDQPGHDPGLPVPLGRADPAGPSGPARLVVHRRSIEARARRLRDREELVHRVLVETLAELLGLPPESVDPGLIGGGD